VLAQERSVEAGAGGNAAAKQRYDDVVQRVPQLEPVFQLGPAPEALDSLTQGPSPKTKGYEDAVRLARDLWAKNPLSRKETFRYIEHRLRVAGLAGTLPFSRGAMVEIYRYSRGIPRVINLVCDRALLAGYSARARDIATPLVKTAIRNIGGRRARRGGRSWRPALAVSGLLALLLGGVGAAYWSGWPAWPVRGLQARRETLAPAVTTAAAVTTPALPPLRAASTAPGGVRGVLVQLLRLWGVQEDLSDAEVAAWPVWANGSPDIPAISARYQLAATFLPETNLAELQAIALPALIELNEPAGQRPYLLRWMRAEAIVLLAPSGDEVRQSPDRLEPLWPNSAWVLWRNVDQLPVDPIRAMTPTVLATVALRLHKLGHLAPPLPGGYEGRLQGAVRAFQREVGLPEDGIVGPRTTLALSRVVGGKFNPTIAEARSR